MTANYIRTKFLEFFRSKKHTIIASDSLVPKDDPTVLFTTAGMQQFKRQFLGHIDDFTRAATCQKCLRTDDLNDVGKTDFHHTFFEMLGNFSFGDYFKKEAIIWAWEFLTENLKLPKEKLWVSVYKDDAEAEGIWLNEVKIPKDRLVRLGDKSNFWPSNAKELGPNGPCGPCSEIFFDYGVNPNCPKGAQCDPDCSCGRFCEVWNLVFTQFNRKEGGILEPLPAKNIDTGMGFERLVAVMQGKRNNFETDIFAPILRAIDQNIRLKNTSKERNERYVIADHIRAAFFGINDGVVPSNDGRGYIMKKLIIDITDIVLRSENKKPVVHKLVPAVVEAMGEAYPEIKKNADEIAKIIHNIENSYMLVRQKRMPELKEIVQKIISKNSNEKELVEELGELTFVYRDTFGLTLPAIEETLIAANVSDNLLKKVLTHYDQFMNKQKEQSRAGSKLTGEVFADTTAKLNVPKTEFLGYSQLKGSVSILKMLVNNQEQKTVKTGDQLALVLDKTPFYAESGGQLGDTGFVRKGSNAMRILDTQKINDIFIHAAQVVEGNFNLNDQVEAQVDVERRLSIMRNHTATHILQNALREVLGSHVKQQGSLVAEDRLRFDFAHHSAIDEKQLQKIEEIVNNHILNSDTVVKESMSLDQAKEKGALAFFAEKYGNTVRVISIGTYSKELCGGTHLDSTSQIGIFKITGESAIAQGIRRLEAKTGKFALEETNQQKNQLKELAKILKSPVSELTEKITQQNQRLKELEKEYETLKFEAIKANLSAEIERAEQLNGIQVYKNIFQNVDMNTLRKISDFVRQKLPSSIIILGSKSNDNASILISSSDDAIKKGFKADELIKKAAERIGGSGGGRPQLAQAGGKDIQKLDEAVQILMQQIKNN